jgi:hypothetical protein
MSLASFLNDFQLGGIHAFVLRRIIAKPFPPGS